MKVAVSIPDAIFAEAESLAKRWKTSRSDVYARALGEFVGLHAPDHVTEAMNQAVAEAGGEIDNFSGEAARRALGKVEW